MKRCHPVYLTHQRVGMAHVLVLILLTFWKRSSYILTKTGLTTSITCLDRNRIRRNDLIVHQALSILLVVKSATG